MSARVSAPGEVFALLGVPSDTPPEGVIQALAALEEYGAYLQATIAAVRSSLAASTTNAASVPAVLPPGEPT